MKKLIIPFFILIFFPFSCEMDNGGGSSDLFFENFEADVENFPWNYITGNGDASSSTGGMTLVNISDSITNLLVDTDAGETNKALQIEPRDSNGRTNSMRGTQFNFKSIGGNEVVLTFDWYVGSNAGRGRLAIQDSSIFTRSGNINSGSYANMFIVFEVFNRQLYHYMGFLPDTRATPDILPPGVFGDNDQSKGQSKLLSAVGMDKWYSVTVTIDFFAKTLSYKFIDFETKEETVPEKTYDFASGINYYSQLASIRFISSGQWITYLDNIKLTGTKVADANDAYYNNHISDQSGYTNNNF